MTDRTLTISVGGSRSALSWAATEISWPDLVARLGKPIRGKESHVAYTRMSKAQQDSLKDVGGFVGGTLRNGRRKARNVIGRDLVTLDLDAIPAGGTDTVLAAVSALGCASCTYSTRKHEPDKPRLRVVLPLDRTVTAEEYEPIARRVAEWLGIENCDPTTFQPFRLMYWPSASADSEYIHDVNPGDFCKAADILGSYANWRNMAEWPQVPGQAAKARETAAKQEDPTEKKGLVGAFCRTFPIRRAMEELIPGAYEPTDDPDRFTYTGGSTAGGAILYDDKWLYSHHATDPASGQLVNAWDLVRLHLYVDRDEGAREGTPANRLPSFTAMSEMALQEPDVRIAILTERKAQMQGDFGGMDPDADWQKSLTLDSKGAIAGSLANLKIIMENDISLSSLATDVFQQRALALGPLPWNMQEGRRDWTDADDTGAAWYLESAYGITDLRRVKMAIDQALDDREVDTLRDYLESLVWDGEPRLDTMLIRYLKADDTPYTRAVTRKTLVAAVARAMEPGCKFDSVLTLVGAQGIAKSQVADILGGGWYSDNVQTFIGKEAAEQLRGLWIVEIPEVDRFTSKYESAAVKQFITRRDDIYREPFAHRTKSHPRRCIFIATTNASDFLVDMTGNRRWWVVQCHATPDARGEDTESLKRDRDQVWAEAVAYWRLGERLTLDASLYNNALAAQTEAREEDPWEGMIAEFIARKVPRDWATRTPEQRRAWWSDDFGQRQAANDLVDRKTICVAEIWTELFSEDQARLDTRTSRRIGAILRTLPGCARLGPQRTAYGVQKCYRIVTKAPVAE